MGHGGRQMPICRREAWFQFESRKSGWCTTQNHIYREMGDERCSTPTTWNLPKVLGPPQLEEYRE